MKNFKKILVTGNAGAGKTTLTKILSTELVIPNYHLDKIVWKPRWQQTTTSEKIQKIRDFEVFNAQA